MTGQDLLDRMELFNQELQLQSGESDAARGLLALNVAQDYFESRVALRPNAMGSNAGTVTTTLSTESTAFPTGVLRIDGLQYVDPTTSRPAWDLHPIRRTGGHAYNSFWPYNLVSSAVSSGKPRCYWTNGTNIYWDPLPSGTHTVRWYGFQVAANITASGTFTYPDIVSLPVAGFATRVMKAGLDDPQIDHAALAEEMFDPVIAALALFSREEAQGFHYQFSHDT